MLHKLYISKHWHISAILIVCCLLFSCQKLDKDGGYYNEKTKSYVYVRPSKKAAKDIGLTSYSNQDIGFSAVGYKVSKEADSLWLYIANRRLYMRIASRLSITQRDDKNKLIKLHLAYVSPNLSMLAKARMKKRWTLYVSGILQKVLYKKDLMIRAWYLTKAGRLKGIVFLPAGKSVSPVTQELNLWMIYQGYSYYFIDQHKQNVNDKLYKQTQTYAKQKKLGLWKY